MAYAMNGAIVITIIGVWWAVTVIVGAARRMNEERVLLSRKQENLMHVVKAATDLCYEYNHSDHTAEEVLRNNIGELDQSVQEYHRYEYQKYAA